MYNRQKRYVRTRKHKAIVFVLHCEPSSLVMDGQAITMSRDKCVLVEGGYNLTGELFDQPEIEHVTSAGETTLNFHANLVVVSMQWLAKSSVGDKMSRGKFQIFLRHVNRKVSHCSLPR